MTQYIQVLFFIFFLNPYMYFMAIEDLHWYTPKQLAVLPIFSMSSNVQVCIIYFVFNTRMKVSGFKFFLTLLRSDNVDRTDVRTLMHLSRGLIDSKCQFCK